MLLLRHPPPRRAAACFFFQEFPIALTLIRWHRQAGLVPLLDLLGEEPHHLTVVDEQLQDVCVQLQLGRVDIDLNFLAFQLSLLTGKEIGAENKGLVRTQTEIRRQVISGSRKTFGV